MTVTPDEGNQNQPTGGQGSPTSATSGGTSQPLPDNIQDLDKRIEAVEKLVKGVQKGADKQIGQLRANVDRILELQSQGLSKAQIERELAIDEILGSQTRTPVPETPAGSRETKASLDLQIIDELLELPANDSRVTKLKLEYGNDARAYKEKALELKRTFNQPPPSPADMPLPQGSAQTEKSVEQLTGDYRKEMLNAPRGKGGMSTRNAIKECFKAQGVDVDNIIFS